MKKTFLSLAFLGTLSACSHQAYKLSGNDIQYIEDSRSGLCFAVVNARTSSQKLAMTAVDCNDVEELLATDNVAESLETAQSAEKIVEKTPTKTKNYFSIGPVFSTF